MTNTSPVVSKTVIYRAALPLNPADWTLDLIRRFVLDAAEQGIPGSTHIRRFPENDNWAFQADNRYYGLGVERVVDLAADKECPYFQCVSHDHPDAE